MCEHVINSALRVWGRAYKCHLNNVEHIQKQIIRRIPLKSVKCVSYIYIYIIF